MQNKINYPIHGLKNHSLYSVWRNMKQRCNNKNNPEYKNYGGRGITICDEWLNDFKVFYDFCMANGWKDGLQIDRTNNDGNYEPKNVGFVTSSVNNLNKRVMGKIQYRGVYLNKQTSKYMARVTINGKDKYIGLYQTPEQGARAYDNFVMANKLPNQVNNAGNII